MPLTKKMPNHARSRARVVVSAPTVLMFGEEANEDTMGPQY